MSQFLTAVPEGPADSLHFRLSGPSLADFEWCAARADFYGGSYLAMAAAAGTATSGSWDKWHRIEGGGWVEPDVAGYDNLFGADCAGGYSWCSESGLGGHVPGVAPEEAGICEVFDGLTCGDGTWTIGITIGHDRLAARGF